MLMITLKHQGFQIVRVSNLITTKFPTTIIAKASTLTISKASILLPITSILNRKIKAFTHCKKKQVWIRESHLNSIWTKVFTIECPRQMYRSICPNITQQMCSNITQPMCTIITQPIYTIITKLKNLRPIRQTRILQKASLKDWFICKMSKVSLRCTANLRPTLLWIS